MQLNKRKTVILSVSIVTGFIAGYLYWRFVGCTSGSCPLTSNWYSSTLFGGVFGYLIGDSFVQKKQAEKTENSGNTASTR
ncbi:MAG: hypothetical protein JXB34_12280 [Bacteroidales bacterium]|nr:hypothetical protein [Bacteroidales bacterium]